MSYFACRNVPYFLLRQGGHKPCLQAFGADQCDDRDPDERKHKSSLFNWWYFGMSSGLVVSISVLMYIQEECWMGFGVLYPNLGNGNSTLCFHVWDKIVPT